MAIPGQSFTIRDPGLGIVPEISDVPLVLGTCSSSTANTLYTFSNPADLVDTMGQGPLVEQAAKILSEAGGPVRVMRLTGSVAGAAGAVTKTAAGSSTGTVTVAGAAYDAYQVKVLITKTGTVGVGEFQYALDRLANGGDSPTWSDVLTIPAGATYAIPNTNLTLTFVPGAGAVFFEAADYHTFDCTAPYYSTTNLGTAVTALLADETDWAWLVLTGEPADTGDGATMFAALDTHLTTFFNQYRYARAMMDAGTDTTANAISDYASSSSRRILVSYGDHDMSSVKPFAGWGTPRVPFLYSVAARAAKVAISTDLARFNEGPLTGVVAVTHDEFRTEVLDSKKFTTSRTYQGVAGFYITNARFMSPAGSDFLYWQHGRMMDVACAITYQTQLQFLSTAQRTNAAGQILDADAKKLEGIVKGALRAALLDPSDAEGNPGHVTRLDYKIDRLADLLGTGTLYSTVAILPKGYVKHIETTLGYTRDV
jgi:hypothetical protein